MKGTLPDVRFWGESGQTCSFRDCPLMTQSGHERAAFAAMHSPDCYSSFVRTRSIMFAVENPPRPSLTLSLIPEARKQFGMGQVFARDNCEPHSKNALVMLIRTLPHGADDAESLLGHRLSRDF